MDNEIKVLLIKMRHYMIEHGVLMGECDAWRELKRMADIGRDQRKDLEWLVAHNAAHNRETPWALTPERLDFMEGKK